MGRTDKLIIPIYKKWLNPRIHTPLAFFGAVPGDKLAAELRCPIDFYDIQLKGERHWDMNDVKWNIQKKYKCIVFLRSSGFAKDPRRLLRQCKDVLMPKGRLLIDWNMGSAHYPRDDPSETWTWGWKYGEHRCYGKYGKKRFELFSSALTPLALRSQAYADLRDYARSTKKYKSVKDFERQIESEFTQQHFLKAEDIRSHFVIEDEKNWSPIRKNGRAQLYTMQVLRK